jgi:ligand-binding sensor domain-containing protein
MQSCRHLICFISWIFIYLSTCQHVFAQGFSSRMYSYSTRDGLPSNVVSKVLTDKDGFTWVLTTNGLARFDGNRFNTILHDNRNKQSIYSGAIKDIVLDEEGVLWVIQGNQLSKHLNQGSEFESFPLPDSLISNQILSCFVDTKKSRVIIGAMGDFLLLDLKTKKYSSTGWRQFVRKQIPLFKPLLQGNSIIPKSGEEYWLLATNGLFSYSTKTNLFNYYPSNLIREFQGLSMYLSAQNKLWMGSYNDGIVAFDIENKTWKSWLLPDSLLDSHHLQSVYSLQFISPNKIIGISRNHVVIFNPSNEQLSSLPILGLEGESVSILPQALFIDKKASRLWIASQHGVLRSLDEPVFDFSPIKIPGGNRFYTQFIENEIDSGFQALSVYTNELISLNKYLRNTQSTKEIAQFPINFISAIRKDPKGNLWICMRNEVIVYDVISAQWIQINLPESPVKSKNRVFWDVVFDAKGFAYTCSWTDGVFQIGSDFKYKKNIPIPTANSDCRFQSIKLDLNHNRLWVATENQGVYCLNLTNNSSFWLKYQQNKPNSLPGYPILDLELAHDGTIWICSATNGLAHFSVEQNLMTHYNQQNGLSSNFTYWCSFDKKGRMWVSCPSSINLFDPKTQTFSSFGMESGWTNQEVFKPSRMRNGELIFGTMNGFFKIREKHFATGIKNPEVYIRGVYLGDSSLSISQKAILNSDQNSITIQFGAIDYTLPDKLQFQYLINSDTAWKNINERELSLINLAPGDYTIQIRAANIHHSWSKPITWQFHIQTPFWRKAWFIVFCISVIALSVYFIIRRQLNSVRTKAQLKQRIAETEMAALRAQMNPHFIFNCLNSIDNLIQQNDSLNAAKYLHRFARLIRDVLEHSRSTEIPFRKDWETIRIYLELEQLRQDGSIQLTFEADAELLQGDYRVPPLLIQPFIENALHHGLLHKMLGEKSLSIVAHIQEDELIYTIEDNGIGRVAALKIKSAQSKDRPSLGVQISSERIAFYPSRLGSSSIETIDLYHADGSAAGTRVIVRLQT